MVNFKPLSLFLAVGVALSAAQAEVVDRARGLRGLPAWENYSKIKDEIPKALKSGAVDGEWKEGGKSFEYEHRDRRWKYDFEKKEKTDIGPKIATNSRPLAAVDKTLREREWKAPQRGRQFPAYPSPSGEWVAFHRDRNVWMSSPGKGEKPITSGATDSNRLRYGTASWVYGEEFYQKAAMWWAPNGRRLAFYKFDESKVPDFYLTLDHSARQTTLDVEPYVKVGAPNPEVTLLVYDLDTQQTVTVDVRSGQAFADGVLGHYVLGVQWSPDGSELLFSRMNRRQNALELCAADPLSGKCRMILKEEQPQSWVDPEQTSLHFLRDGKRFIWTSERTGWKSYFLYDLSGKVLCHLTPHDFEVGEILRLDEATNQLFYLARSGDNHMKMQLHRGMLDGSDQLRLTDPRFHHRVDLAPNGQHFLDVYETHDQAPASRLISTKGELISELEQSDLTKWDELKLERPRLFTFKAADGKTDLHGLLYKPSRFDRSKKWPLLVSVYAGPATNGAKESFSLPPAITELGFLVAMIDSRSAAGRGKKFLDAINEKLGIVEIDDQAAGVKALCEQRPYVDGSRVGIYGTSYGGTVSALAPMRYPEVFQAGSASSGVMDFRNYDSIYTERYMGLLPATAAAYDAGCPLTYVNQLKGRLLIFYGTADNNVHPSNSLQLIAALQRANKSFDVQVGVDEGHVSVNRDRMMEFFSKELGAGPR